MIANEQQMQQTVEQMGRMCRALAALQTDVFPKSRQQFALMAEGPLEQLRALERDLSQFIDQTLKNESGDDVSVTKPASSLAVGPRHSPHDRRMALSDPCFRLH